MSRPASNHPELDAVLHLLGTVSDQDVADKVGLSASVVGRHRRRLGIKPYEGYKFAPKSESADDSAAGSAIEAAPAVVEAPVAAPALVAAPAPEPAPVAWAAVAEVAEVEAAPVAAEGRSKLTPYQHLIGHRPDREVAELANVTVEAVRMFRKRRGIKVGAPEAEAPVASTKAAKVPGRRRSALDPHIGLIGKLSDAEVAALAGVTPENVRAFRNRHGIAASYRGGSAAPAEAPARAAAAPAVAPASAVAAPMAKAAPVAAAAPAGAATDAWSLRSSSGAVYVVLAAGFVAAATEAAARLAGVEPHASVVAIDRIGVALR